MTDALYQHRARIEVMVFERFLAFIRGDGGRHRAGRAVDVAYHGSIEEYGRMDRRYADELRNVSAQASGQGRMYERP